MDKIIKGALESIRVIFMVLLYTIKIFVENCVIDVINTKHYQCFSKRQRFKIR